MKINGQEVNGPYEDILVLPRKPQPVVFKGRALANFDLFDKLRPMPTAPGVLTKDGFKPDPKDKGYLQQLAAWTQSRLAYMVVQTLEPSNIEWDSVVLDNPTTWHLWVDDMVKAGFTDVEQKRILDFVLEVNCLDEKKLEAARADFLLGLEPAQGS